MGVSLKDGDAAPVSLGVAIDPVTSDILPRHQPEYGQSSTNNVSASTVIKATAGRVFRVSVVTAGSAAGAVHDAATTGAAAAGNKIATIPNAVGIYDLNWPCTSGIVLIPGTGQVLAISYT